MDMNYNKEAEKLTVMPEGRLDTLTARELEAAFGDLLTGVSELILNMEKVTYVSSAGLRVILKIQKIMMKQGTMKLTKLNEGVMEVFEITGFSSILKIE